MRHLVQLVMWNNLAVAIDHRMVHFRTSDLDEVVGEVEQIGSRATGQEWVTIAPWVDPENLPIVSLLRRIFSARGSQVPEATWVPATDKEPAQLGVIHATGPDAFDRILEAGVEPPSTWRKIGDHSKRGLLFAVHPDTEPEIVVRFAVQAAAALAAVPTDDRWVAQISTSS